MKNIVIIGSTGHARVVIDTVELEQKYRIAGLIDRVHKLGRSTLGYDVIGVEEDLPELMLTREVAGAIVAIGDNFTMKDFSSLAPNVATGGNCTIGELAAIGIGSSLIHGVSVGDCSVIGAGSTVLQDIPAGKLAYGTPADMIRDREPGDNIYNSRALVKIHFYRLERI